MTFLHANFQNSVSQMLFPECLFREKLLRSFVLTESIKKLGTQSIVTKSRSLLYFFVSFVSTIILCLEETHDKLLNSHTYTAVWIVKDD